MHFVLVQHGLRRIAEQPFWQERRLYAKHLEKQKEEAEEEVGDVRWSGRLRSNRRATKHVCRSTVRSGSTVSASTCMPPAPPHVVISRGVVVVVALASSAITYIFSGSRRRRGGGGAAALIPIAPSVSTLVKLRFQCEVLGSSRASSAVV